MRIVLFCHSLLSDWNHGNAHFLRGLASELVARGHELRAWEPEDAWSAVSLEREMGALPVAEVAAQYPLLDITRYSESELELELATDGADVVLVHEWTSPRLVEELGRRRKRGAGFLLLFHDTHHRLVSDEAAFGALDLSGYDAVLAFGAALRERYAARGWGARAFTFHEAADVRVFRPLPEREPDKDIVFVGNWGDGERTVELREFLLEPAASLGLSGTVYGVRYPEDGLRALGEAGLDFGGRLANYHVPLAFAGHDMTMHVPRRPYVEALPGTPTIRVFEALACGIPLVSAPWSDVEALFRADDFLMVRSGDEARSALRFLRHEPSARRKLAARGLETVLARHTCSHRADELLQIVRSLGKGRAGERRPNDTGGDGAVAWD
jgi:spore maturation protein CgeB